MTLRQDGHLLTLALRGNGIFSLISGVAALLLAGSVANLLGLPSPAVISVTGVILLGYAGALLYVTANGMVTPQLGWVAVVLDVLWVMGSAVLIFGGLLDVTPAGKWLIAILADIVLLFAILQAVGIRRLS